MKRSTLALIAIVAIGIALRLYRLDAIPPGMTHDEADVGYHAAALYQTGQRVIVDAPYGYINQPFVQYSGALLMHLFGPTDLTQRLHSVIFGTLLIIATYLWARAAFDTSIALTAAAFMAVGFWPLMTSRFALNNQPVPALFTAGLWLLWRTFTLPYPHPSKRIITATASGLCIGVAVYAYEAGRAVLASLPFLGIYLLMLQRTPYEATPVAGGSRSIWRTPFLIAFVVALLVAAPHLLDPNSWRRTGTLVSETVGAGGTQSLFNTIAEGLGTLFIKGDPFVTYNIPDRSILDPILAVPFVIGLLIALRKWRAPVYGYTLIWLIFGLAPTLIVGAFTSTIHSIAAQPPVYVLLSIGVTTIARYASRIRRQAGPVPIIALLAFSTVITFNDYFLDWGDRREVRAAYYDYFRSMLHEVNTRIDVHDVAISSVYPDVPLDPFIAGRELRREDVTLRHFNAQHALVFPNTDSALLLIPDLAPLNPLLATSASSPEASGNTYTTYNWNPRAALDDLSSRLTPFDATFGGAIRLIGAHIDPAQATRGTTVNMLTLWRVIDPDALGPIDASLYDHTAALFTHMLDANGAIVAQDDRLDAPASSWQAGDAFVQIHRLLIRQDVATGSYRLFVGVYLPPNNVRLHLADGSDAIAIGTLEVSP